jgi:hypothetical protein
MRPLPARRFFPDTGGVFALYDRNALEDEIGSEVTTAPFGAMTLAWNAKARDDVDTMFAKAVAAGARSVKEPQEAFWGGYSSYVGSPWSAFAGNRIQPILDRHRRRLRAAAWTHSRDGRATALDI